MKQSEAIEVIALIQECERQISEVQERIDEGISDHPTADAAYIRSIQDYMLLLEGKFPR